jgi:hypothetical protein
MNMSAMVGRYSCARSWVLLATMLATTAGATELVGFALMPANTFAVGPTSGQFTTGAGGNSLPLIDKQPVQGFSAVLAGPSADTFYVMPDNGFGTKPNSPDALLRIYAVKPDFREWTGRRAKGSGTVSPVDFQSGHRLAAFEESSFISLRDPNHKIDFQLVAEKGTYPNSLGVGIQVDPSIVNGRLLTGADFDIESVRRDRHGNFWFGEEFGPFLIQADATGKVLRREISTPNIVPPGSTSSEIDVKSPQNPFLGSDTPNLLGSHGFEGMAISPDRTKLYPLFEGTVAGDNAVNNTVDKNLRIDEFDIKAARYTGKNWLYSLDASGTNIGDMTAVNDHQFLVLERNGATATAGVPFKKIFLIDIAGVAEGGFVKKTQLVDLMNIQDPHDLNGDGSTSFTFPFVTIESVLILNPTTLLVINDNNYPGVGGRDLNSDNTEFLKLRLDQALQVTDRDSDDDGHDHDDKDDKDDHHGGNHHAHNRN